MEKKIIINIGRQFGSAGKEVAFFLGQKLGIPVYDNNLIEKAAEQSGFDPEVFKHQDEKHSVLSIGSIFGSNRYGHYTHNAMSDSELFQIQSDVIRDLASNGSAVFVGRLSDYILRDMKTLDVFIHAPLDLRIRSIAERHSLSLQEAQTLVLKEDKGRKKNYDFYTLGDNWGVASNYDLCVDSSLLGPEGTAEFIIEFGRKSGLI